MASMRKGQNQETLGEQQTPEVGPLKIDCPQQFL